MEQFRECGKGETRKEVKGLSSLAIINNHQRVLRVLQPLDKSSINTFAKSHITLIERGLI